MWEAGFVANVVLNGNILNDENGAVALPFGSEYKLRLRNKTDRDAVAQVFIDGRNATEGGDLIVHAKGIIELERFLEDIDTGRKFKFVSLDAVTASERTNPKNGLVEIRFRLTKRPTERVIYHHPIVEEHHYYYPEKIVRWHGSPSWTANEWRVPMGQSSGLTYDASKSGLTYTNSVSGSSTGSVYCCSNTGTAGGISAKSCSVANISDVSDGKTVEGEVSDQQFKYSYIGELETHETVIRLNLVGYDSEVDKKCCQTKPKKYCSDCGKAFYDKSKFCSDCGSRLSK